jgi:hypothetical protein
VHRLLDADIAQVPGIVSEIGRGKGARNQFARTSMGSVGQSV